VSLLRQALWGLALLVMVGLSLRLGFLERQAAQAQVQAAEDAQRLSAAAIDTLWESLQRERNAQTKLRQQQDHLAQLAAQRQRLIEELKHANAQLAHWARQPLPDVARRLHQRPPLTGASAYRDWLSGRGALHTEPNRAEH
jgi:LysB family phage lysis regulatory protein